MTTSTRPAAGTRAATVHQTVYQLRQAAADPVHPGLALRMIRTMNEEQAKSALAVCVVSERWSPEERRAMAYPPQPDFDAIADENQRLREAYLTRATTDSAVSFMEDAA